MTDIKFAAIGINHSHIYGQVECLLEAGAQFVAFYAIKMIMGLRVSAEEEIEGLDIGEHGNEAYPDFSPVSK